MATIKTKKISQLGVKTDITPAAKLPIIDTDNNGVTDNFVMDVSRLTELAKGDKGDTGLQGPVGPVSTVPGPQGPAGPANSLSIGTVQSGPTAQATITGSAPSQQLSLVLPKGDKGDKGEIGPPGPAGSGSGDMIISTYDPAGGARQVAFADQLGSGDHGALTGLSDDDHMQYALADGSRGNFAPVLHNHQVTDINASGRTTSNFLRGDGTWQLPVDTTYAEITTAEIDAGTASTLRTITARRVQYIKDWVTTAIATMKAALTKADVGLANVDNTSDANKPVSTATQSAIDAVIANGVDGFHAALTPTANKIPVLDGNAKMPLTTIPGYAFKARRTTNLSSPSNNSMDIVFDGKLYDFGNWYSTSTGLATAPVNGVYHFEASAFVENVTTSRAFFFSRGSALSPQERGMDPDSANIRRAKGTWEIYMTAGQTFGVNLYTNYSNQLNNVDTWLTGHLVIAG